MRKRQQSKRRDATPHVLARKVDAAKADTRALANARRVMATLLRIQWHGTRCSCTARLDGEDIPGTTFAAGVERTAALFCIESVLELAMTRPAHAHTTARDTRARAKRWVRILARDVSIACYALTPTTDTR